ncbi:MAG: DnaD domain protein [Ruminococcaceae bacterium]|nr:DnaD domain protein [Oscillospiraceae bacterium]
MSRNGKIYINYGGYDSRYDASIKGADENDLMILGGLFLLANSDGEVDITRAGELLSIDRAEIAASVKYWKGAGVLASARTAAASKNDKEENTAHKGGVITHSGVEEYSNEELAAVIEHRVGTAFIDEAQKAMGKMFNKNEVGKLIGIVDQLGFEEEAVLAILSYCVRIGKKSISYAEKIAVSFHDEDISSAAQVHAQIDFLERRNTSIEKIRGLFGFGGRALSPTEKKLFAAWTEEYGFDFDVVEKAYNITVDAIHDPAPKYTDKILKNWHEKGLRNVEEIDTYIAEEKQNAEQKARSGVKVGVKNNYAEEWLEQLLDKKF